MAPRTRATPNIRSFFQAPSATQDRTTPTSSQKRVAQRKHTQTGATPSADSSAEDMAEKIILDPRGDVVLLAGSPPTHSVKVSFACIAAASPVFTALLSGPFSEGQVKRSIEQPQQVALPEDDAQAITDICHLLYHQVADLQNASPLSAERLYHLVKTADKYDCLAVLRFQVCALAQAHFDHLGKPECGHLVLRVAAAYLLDEPKYFKIATTQLITCSNEPLSACRKLEGGEILSGGALLIMAEKRAKAHRAIISGLRDGEFCDLCQDGVGSFEYREELESTFKITSWPPSSETSWKTISEMLECMKKTKYLRCGETKCGRMDFLELAEEIEGICKGLCIVCVKEDQLDLDDGKCKHKGKGKSKGK